jgi:aminoglycoside phosphotransferase (APT) family kinase protein
MRTDGMHADEIATDAGLVRRLLAAQFPRWADLPIERVVSSGTDHAIYRLGDALAARLPLRPSAAGQVEKEHRWLPLLAPLLPLAVPVPLARGTPGEGYPWPWSVCPWLEGEEAPRERIADPSEAADALAGFVLALQRIDATGGPPPGEHNFFRGVPLATRDARTRDALARLRGVIDTAAAAAAWEAALRAPAWDGAPVWIHGDLRSGNLLAVRGRISAVIDFGGLGVGDPACDLIVAWELLSAEDRERFRAALGVDHATWARGRGWALSVALIGLPYYLETNADFVRYARRMLDEVLADPERAP